MPKQTATDTRWLEQHGRKWRVTVAVPRDLQGVLGTRLKRDLHTDSLALANRLKLPVVSELQARIDSVRQIRSGKPASVMREAAEIAKIRERTMSAFERSEIDVAIRQRGEDILGAEVARRNVMDGNGDDDMEPVFDRRREALAHDFVAVATGSATPLASLHARYLEKSHVKPRTKADDVRAMRYLIDWCERERVPVTVQAITAKIAIRFSNDLGEICGGLTERTQNKYLGRLSRYWKYLVRQQAADANPWSGIQLEVPRTKHGEEERAFDDQEVQRLLMGGAQTKLMDVMMIGALAGARLDAIVDLKVKDTIDGAFTFKPQKREPSARDVPIHPALGEIVERRTAGRQPDDDFFPDWPAPKKEGSMRERSFKASNAFTAYRRSCGVDQVVEGKRRALVNFHSFRRWFCTKAERTGAPGDLVAAIVGHKRSGLTLGRYSEGPEWKAAKKCIAKVKLPPLDGRPVNEERGLRPRNRS